MTGLAKLVFRALAVCGGTLVYAVVWEHWWYGRCRDWWGAAHCDWPEMDVRRWNRETFRMRLARHGRWPLW